MKIDYDTEMDEYYLKFLDNDDRKKKSNFLKTVFKNDISVVTMSISEKFSNPTQSQLGMYKAFIILLKGYTGYTEGDIKDLIYKNINTSEEEIKSFSKSDFSSFIDNLYQMCAENIGINVEMRNGKLIILKPENE